MWQGGLAGTNMTDPTKLVDAPMSTSDVEMSVLGAEAGAPLIKQLEIHAGLLNLAWKEEDRQLVGRVLHHLPRFGAMLDKTTISALASKYCTDGNIYMCLINLFNCRWIVGERVCKMLGEEPGKDREHSKIVEIYVWLLLAYWHTKNKRYTESLSAASQGIDLCGTGSSHRCLDPLQARLFSHLSLAHEKLGLLVDLRHRLMLALRKTSLRHEQESHALIYNWILRSYVLAEQHDLAAKFVAKSVFPASASGAQASRFHYYMARVEAVQTNYRAAREHVEQAIRKAPHTDACTGLLQAAQKLAVVVQLLLGDIPERSLFSQPKLARSLKPYLSLCQSVRLGDLSRFQKTIAEHHTSFHADRTDSLVSRLHQNVLRAGLKRLAAAYIRVPLAEVCTKLGLPSVDDAEFVILKAIKEGVINATVDHSHQFMECKPSTNTYYTSQPHSDLHHRIQGAQALYKHSMMAMRYPNSLKPEASTIDLDSLSNEMDLMEEYLEADDMDF